MSGLTFVLFSRRDNAPRGSLSATGFVQIWLSKLGSCEGGSLQDCASCFAMRSGNRMENASEFAKPLCFRWCLSAYG